MATAAPYNPPSMSAPREIDEVVRKTAALARLDITAEEVARLAPQFAQILEAFQTISRLDVGAARPMTRAGGEVPRMRPDLERPSLEPDAALGNAPERIEDFYSVPKTIARPGTARGDEA